jgi:transposase
VEKIGDASDSPEPKKLVGYTALCPRVYQAGGKDHCGHLAKNGPVYLRWALIEAATHAWPATVLLPGAHQRTRPRWAAAGP